MKALASATLAICATGFSSTIATAQTPPLVGKWQTKVQWTGDIDMVMPVPTPPYGVGAW
jgi:hypothetical protein